MNIKLSKSAPKLMDFYTVTEHSSCAYVIEGTLIDDSGKIKGLKHSVVGR